MKKLFLFLNLLIAGITANAQFTPYNNLNYMKLLKTPPNGLPKDSVLVYDSSDQFVKMRPTSTLVPEHNSLSGLQGGAAGEYNHLTNAQITKVNNAANDSDVLHKTLDETKNGNLGVNSLILASNPIGSVANEIKQTIGVNDWWKIYGKTDVSDISEVVFEVGDNGEPFSDIGQRFRFHYNADATGLEKDPVIIDYNDVTMDTNLGVSGNVLIGGAMARGFSKEVGVMGSTNAAFTLSTTTQLSDIVTSTNDSFQFIDRTLGATVFRMAVGSGNATFLGSITAPSYSGGATLTGTPTAPTAPAGTNTTQIATTAFVSDATVQNGIITTSTNITNTTLTDTSLPQNGKTLYISNGATNINYTVNGSITASFVKGGTGSITFVQGSGRTMVAANGTLVFNGAQYFTASVVSFGTTDIVYINNF